jgi:hypothetical protein
MNRQTLIFEKVPVETVRTILGEDEAIPHFTRYQITVILGENDDKGIIRVHGYGNYDFKRPRADVLTALAELSK